MSDKVKSMSSNDRETKEDLEIRKLRAEINQIAAPFWTKTTFWLAGITLGIAVPGWFIQWATSTIRFERAELASQQGLRDVRVELEKTRRDINDQRIAALQELEAIKFETRKISRPALDLINQLGGFGGKINFEISEDDFYMLGFCVDENKKGIACKVELLDAEENILEVVTSNDQFGGVYALRIPEKARDLELYEVSMRLSAEGKKTKHAVLFSTGPYVYRSDFRPAD